MGASGEGLRGVPVVAIILRMPQRPRKLSAISRVRWVLLTAAPAVFLWIACSNDSPIGPGPVVAIFLNPTTLTVDQGLTGKIQAFALDKDSAALIGKRLSFVSDNPAVATVDSTGLVNGLTIGNATVTFSADGVNGQVPVTVSQPGLGITPDTLGFSATAGGADPAAQSTNLTSLRGGPVDGLAVGTIVYGPGATNWIASTTLSGTSAPATLTVQVTTGALAAGSYSATIPVTSTSAGNSPQNLFITFDVNPPGPRIGLSATTLDFGATVGGSNPPSQGVDITNLGAGTLDQLSVGTITYGAGATNWIASASLNTSTAPATLTVQLATGALAAGNYTATVPIVSPVATNTPQDVTVNFNVNSISFATDVQPIFNSSCTGCHFTGSVAPDLTAANAYAAIVGITSTCNSLKYVNPNSPSTSFLLQKMDGTQGACGASMPFGSAILPQATRDIIRHWILAGAPNN